MGNRKRYGSRVIRSRRNMYKARKSGARRAVETVGMIVVVGGICFLGYSLGAPLLDYFTSGKASQTSEATSFTTSAPLSESPDATDTPATEITTTATTAPEMTISGTSAYIVPESALLNTASLSAVAAQAKNSGYTAVVLQLKNATGYLNYKSQIEAIKDGDIIKGGLTLAEIVNVCENAGLTPIAKISTLCDCKIQAYIGNIGYRFADDSYSWLDAAPENGGKQWANPLNSETAAYIADVTEEIANGGIRAVILENTEFPELKPYDKTVLPANVQSDDRYKALVNIVTECAKRVDGKGVKLIVEADAAEIVAGYGGLTGTAEILRGKTQLENVAIAVVYDDESFGEELKTGADSSTPLPKDLSQRFSAVLSQVKRYTGQLELVPCLDGGISQSELDEIRGMYTTLGCSGEIIG